MLLFHWVKNVASESRERERAGYTRVACNGRFEGGGGELYNNYSIDISAECSQLVASYANAPHPLLTFVCALCKFFGSDTE